ncbi:platelet-activating factor acetylhydrolase, isoform II-domain-containing protein [Microdochium trichocladiopsis]|uniref:Putative phospholipase n=1 Tax=Microdochium trichocladiopsis TaxID=1682393 RepID=A0A9P8YCA0_9PEZI|nr:platelet-activating factor acetylhydrolase, isoform II-domain-containing protein [Microdochium trichocladiopsis]KAH7033458.1 platelet-activating factor acetylhydrolase, isoform II-domain-containing protein [Microdochium trichocladiopsis]
MPGKTSASASERLAAYLSRLNPVPGFADYTGPYKVGTVDIEIPVADLHSPAPAPANAADIDTVSCRIFYPAHPDAEGKRITWVPAPQRHTISSYIQFLGAGPTLASAASFLPRHLHYTTIPVVKNAPLLEPNTLNRRWPTAIFSHGLGGNRNAYSQIVGSLASHGVVVVCPEHRDGSSVVSFIRDPAAQPGRYFRSNNYRTVPYNRIPHDATDEIHALRDDQLRIRLWELGLIHDAILAIDGKVPFRNLNTSTPSLDQFAGAMHVQEPGSMIFAGHSFGSATMVQFLKSVYYAGTPELDAMAEPLYTPSRESALCKQITPKNVTILLDMWCFPLLSKPTKALHDLPLPVYADTAEAPGGNALLAIESQDFFKWKEHLHATARILSPNPAAQIVEPTAYERPQSRVKLAEPHFYYVQNSAHLNQSDFGLLFPMLTKKIFGAVEPERAIRLNLRAMLQVLRNNSIPVGCTWVGDLVDGGIVDKLSHTSSEKPEASPAAGDAKDVSDGVYDDQAIFSRNTHHGIEAWGWIDIMGMGHFVKQDENGSISDESAAEATEPAMASVIEPSAADEEADAAVKDAAAKVVSQASQGRSDAVPA